MKTLNRTLMLVAAGSLVACAHNTYKDTSSFDRSPASTIDKEAEDYQEALNVGKKKAEEVRILVRDLRLNATPLEEKDEEERNLDTERFERWHQATGDYTHAQYLKCGGRKLELNEQCDLPGERKKFEDLMKRIQNAQDANKRNHSGTDHRGVSAKKLRGQVFRGFHAKSHGCLAGALDVLPKDERPEWTHKGIFDTEGEYKVWTRFSNGTGVIQSDASKEPRGLAIKVVGLSAETPRAKLYGKNYADVFEKTTQDFLMTNKPFATTEGPVEFIEFSRAVSTPSLARRGLRMLNLVRKYPYLVEILLKINTQIKNVATETYWSGVPIALGRREGGFYASKFFVAPCSDAPYVSNPAIAKEYEADWDNPEDNVYYKEHYGREWLKKLSSNYDICYDLFFQKQTNLVKTSVEDGLDEWTVEESPPVKVARMTLPKGQPFESEDKLCERMRFNPFNAIADHTPMSDTNQARGLVYLASAQHREKKDWTGKKKTVEPTLEQTEQYLKFANKK